MITDQIYFIVARETTTILINFIKVERVVQEDEKINCAMDVDLVIAEENKLLVADCSNFVADRVIDNKVNILVEKIEI